MEVDYSVRAPSDLVLSGPIDDGPGRGQRFASQHAAELWASVYYGSRYRGPVPPLGVPTARWAVLIKAPDKGEGDKQ